MIWDEHASNMIPLVKRLDYYEDYERAVFDEACNKGVEE